MPNLCTHDATLDRIIKEKFLSNDIFLPTTSDLTQDNKTHLAQDILKLEEKMRSQVILMILEQRRVRLFGLLELVKQTEQELEEIKKKYASNTVKLSIEQIQAKIHFSFFFFQKLNIYFL